jgi:hypothetical protein
MKIKYTGKALFVSNGVTYEDGLVSEVSNKIGEYLTKTFPAKFETIKTKPKIVKPKETVKPVSKDIE